MEEQRDYRAEVYNQEEIEARQALSEELTREKRQEDAEQAERSYETNENEE
jgi:hypothetical protein